MPKRSPSKPATADSGGSPSLAIEYWDAERAIDYPKNARTWTQKAIDKVRLSLREFGFRQPVVVDKDDVIVIGHLRRQAAREEGISPIPVHIASELSPDQIRQLRLMDNRSHDEAQWDLTLLTEEMKELAALNLNLVHTGFDSFVWPGEFGAIPTWAGMPEFNHEDVGAWKSIRIHFAGPSDMEDFSKLIKQPIDEKTHYLWHPRLKRLPSRPEQHYAGDPAQPRYPVYVISKGRHESRATSKALEKMKIPYRIVVEPREFEQYAAVIDRQKILQLPFSNLGLGSIPARNWVWEHSIGEGHERHWILGDNIWAFYRFHENRKTVVTTGATFRAAEDFADRYENVALAGFQYESFITRKQKHPPFILNTRIYSCILVQNSTEERWRGRYNEDTDLSLRVLKAGMCTVLFNAFLANKQRTMAAKGGNTDELYKGDGRLKMAQSLHLQHPDVVTIKKKWNRWQHVADYRPFKANKFIPREGFTAPTEKDDYGMQLYFTEGEQQSAAV